MGRFFFYLILGAPSVCVHGLDLSENDSGCHPCVYWRKLHRRCLFEWFLGYWVSINRLCGFRTSSRIIWRAGLAIISRKRLSSLYKNDLPRASRRCWSNAPRGTWRLFVGTSYEVIVVAKTFHLHKATIHSLLRKLSFVQLSSGQAGLFCRVFQPPTRFVTYIFTTLYLHSLSQFVTYNFTTLHRHSLSPTFLPHFIYTVCYSLSPTILPHFTDTVCHLHFYNTSVVPRWLCYARVTFRTFYLRATHLYIEAVPRASTNTSSSHFRVTLRNWPCIWMPWNFLCWSWRLTSGLQGWQVLDFRFRVTTMPPCKLCSPVVRRMLSCSVVSDNFNSHQLAMIWPSFPFGHRVISPWSRHYF